MRKCESIYVSPNSMHYPQANKKNIRLSQSIDYNPRVKDSSKYSDLLQNHIKKLYKQQSQHNKQNQNSSHLKYQNSLTKSNRLPILSKVKKQERSILNCGSLLQFLSENDKNSSLYINKKKKTQIKNEQIKLKKICFNQSAQNVIMSDTSTLAQKKIASKIFISKIFQDVYHQPLQAFYTSNMKMPTISKHRINLPALDNVLTYKQQVIEVKMKRNKKGAHAHAKSNLIDYGSINDGQTVQFQQVTDNNKKNMQRNVCIYLDQQSKQRQIGMLKSLYAQLKDIEIVAISQQLMELIRLQNELQSIDRLKQQSMQFTKKHSPLLVSARNSLLQSSRLMLTSLNTNIDVQSRMQQLLTKFKAMNSKICIQVNTVVKLSDQQVIFRKIQITDAGVGLAIISRIKFQKINKFVIEHLVMEQCLFGLFIDVMVKNAPKHHPLQQFNISSVAFDNPSFIVDKLANLFLQVSMIKLTLNFVDFSNRDFTKICSSLRTNKYLEEIQFRNNKIDHFVSKSIQSILKNCPNIKKIDLRNNQNMGTLSMKIKDQRLLY